MRRHHRPRVFEHGKAYEIPLQSPDEPTTIEETEPESPAPVIPVTTPANAGLVYYRIGCRELQP